MRYDPSAYNAGWAIGSTNVTNELAKRERPGRWARAELARLRSTRNLALRDDFGWGYRDGMSTTLANFLYRVDDLP